MGICQNCQADYELPLTEGWCEECHLYMSGEID